MTESQIISSTYNKQHKLYVKRVRPLFLRALNLQLQSVLQWMETSTMEPPLDLLVDPKLFRTALKQAYEMVGITAARREYYYQKKSEDKGIIDFLVDKWRQVFTNYALNYAYQVESDLSETTKEQIRTALAEARELGLNQDRTITYIKRAVGGVINRQRATVIAITETTTASNLGKEVGAKEYFKETNQGGYKQFIGREDARERHSHFALNDTYLPIDENWTFTDEEGRTSYGLRPGDTSLPARERVRCRCTQLFLSERRYNRLKK